MKNVTTVTSTYHSLSLEISEVDSQLSNGLYRIFSIRWAPQKGRQFIKNVMRWGASGRLWRQPKWRTWWPPSWILRKIRNCPRTAMSCTIWCKQTRQVPMINRLGKNSRKTLWGRRVATAPTHPRVKFGGFGLHILKDLNHKTCKVRAGSLRHPPPPLPTGVKWGLHFLY